MSLMRWDPFADMDTIFNRMLPAGLSRWPRLAGSGGKRKLEWAPAADISETDQEFLIRAELPAVKKEDVQVTLDEGIITIKGERRQQSGSRAAAERQQIGEISPRRELLRQLRPAGQCQRGQHPLREQGRRPDSAHSQGEGAEDPT